MDRNKDLNSKPIEEERNSNQDSIKDAKSNKDKLPVPRLFVYPEDIARMTGWKMSHATGLYYRIRRKLKKRKGAEVTWKEYCHYVQVWEEEVLPYMRMPLTLKVLLISLLLFSFSKLLVNRFPQLRELFNEKRIEWKESLPGYQRGQMQVKNPETGKMETVEIEVEEMTK